MIIKNKFKFIYLEITNYCNMNCPFCVSPNVSDRRYLDIEKFKKYILNIKEFTNTVYLHVLGEPLLHPKFKEIIKICNENNINVRWVIGTTTSYFLSNQYVL